MNLKLNHFRIINWDFIIIGIGLIITFINPTKGIIFFLIGTVFFIFMLLLLKQRQDVLYIDYNNFGFVSLLFLCCLSVSLVYTILLYENSSEGVSQLITIYLNYISYFILFFFTYQMTINKKAHTIPIFLLSVGSLVLSSFVIYYSIALDMFLPVYIHLDIVQTSNILAISVPFMFAYYTLNKSKIMFLLTFVGIIALIITSSRSSFFGMLVSLIVYLKIRFKNKAFIIYAVLIAIFIPTTIVINSSLIGKIVAITTSVNRNSSQSISTSGKESVEERFRLWTAAGKMFADNILLGVGLRQFQNAYEIKYAPLDALRKDLPHAHNNIINFLGEGGLLLGIPFLILSLTLLFMWFEKGKLNSDYAIIGFTISLSYFITGLFDMNFASSAISRVYFVLVGFCYAMMVREKKEKMISDELKLLTSN